MKRYRVLGFDFDSRALTLEPMPDHWKESVKELHRANQARTIATLKTQYGECEFDRKLKDFIELGPKPFSIVAFHNRFLTQARHAFAHGQYYPALTAVCALGERVLNHLVIRLRDHYKAHALYKKVYRKDSFDYWPLAIDALAQWGVLTPEAEAGFRDLAEKRNNALHFNLFWFSVNWRIPTFELDCANGGIHHAKKAEKLHGSGEGFHSQALPG